MQKIKTIHAREILDSRDDPTIEVDITLSDGSIGRASVPSGASIGNHEAVELRDNDKNRYGGKGVLKAIDNINTTIQKAIIDQEFDQKSLDDKLISIDGTPNKSNLGANATLAVSLAFARALSISSKRPLYEYFKDIIRRSDLRMPVPLMNVINGGKHAENSTDIQEFMIVPHGFTSFKRALQAGVEIFDCLHKILDERKMTTTVGDEGGFAPQLPSNESAIEIIIEAISGAGYKTGKEVSLALDIASTVFYKDGMYDLSRDKRILTTEEMIGWYEGLVNKYPIVSIEDGLAEDDWDGWALLTDKLGKKIQLVGDDLFATNLARLSKGIEKKVANSILIKPNQIGTISETIQVIDLAKKAGYSPIVSHRSGETEDVTIADFAVGTDAGQIKTGSLSRTDRIAKYNQLLRIEEELGDKASFAKFFEN
ncbi:MAG: phosphopyruvate hydratase [Candidatus Paceibacterota bacterium]|jgi:enolase